MAKEKDLTKDSGAESMAAASGKKNSKPKKAAAKKASKRSASKAGKSRVASAAKRATESVEPIDVAVQDIELRAYYIAERRRNMGWPGNERSDWIEAERQLREESQRKRKRSR